MKSFLLKYVQNIKKKLIIFSILNVFSSLIGVLIPLISGTFVDSLVESNDHSIILKFILLSCLCVIIQLALALYVQLEGALLQTRLIYDIQKDALDEIQQTQLYHISKFDKANLSQCISSDSTSIATFMISTGSSLLVCIFNFFFSLVLLFSVKWEIALFILTFLIFYIIYFYFLQKKIVDKQRKLKSDYSHYFAQIYSQLNNLKNLKIFRMQNYYNDTLFHAFTTYKDSLMKFKIFSFSLSSGDILLTFFAQIIIFIFGGMSVMKGSMTIGIFSVLVSYFNMMLSSIKFIPSITTQFSEMSASYYRIIDLTTLDRDKSGSIKQVNSNIIRMNNVSIKFPDSEEELLKYFNYSFMKGSIYCLKGTNGSGKTTVLDIITKLNFSYEGSISIDNIEIEKLDTDIYHNECVSYMTQEAFAINDSLEANLLMYDESRDLKTLIRKLGLEKYLKQEDDISTIASGGEKQKISFLRSIIKPFKVLLLDEPTNHLDAGSKIIIMEYLNTIKEDSIIIISSHDNFVVEQSDLVIDLNNDYGG